MAKMAMPRWAKLAWCLLLAAAAGCDHPQPPGIGAYLSSPQDLQRTHRVVFIEMTQESSFPDVYEDMTQSLFRQIQSAGLFHVDLLKSDDPQCRDLPLDSRYPYTVTELAQMRQAFGCDALLLGRVTQFRAYPQMQIGLFLRLLDLRQGKLIWAVENVWDTTDKATETRLKEYYKTQLRSGYDPADAGLLIRSPKAFEKFVAYEVAGTLIAGARGEEAKK